MNIRFARKADAADILAIYGPYITDTAITFEYEIPTEAAFQQRMEGIMEKFPYVVCEDAGKVVGYAYAHPYRERKAFDWSAELSVYVAESHQRMGIATVLYGAVLKCLMAQGFYMAYAIVVSPNEKSETFHRDLGFRVTGELDHAGFKLGAWRDNLYLQKPLQPKFDVPKPVIPIGELPDDVIEDILARSNGQLS